MAAACRYLLYPMSSSERFQRTLETLGADFYHLRVSGTIPAMFVNHLVPKYNSLSISVNKTGLLFCQFSFLTFHSVKFLSSAVCLSYSRRWCHPAALEAGGGGRLGLGVSRPQNIWALVNPVTNTAGPATCVSNIEHHTYF